MHNCILKSHLSVEHRENYSQNTVRKLFHKNFFPKFPFRPNFVSPFSELPEMSSAKTHISHPILTSHSTTLSTRALFLHFGRLTYPVTVDRRLLATSVSCPHLPSHFTIRLNPPKKPRRAPHPAEHQPNSLQKKPPPSSDAGTIKIRNIRPNIFAKKSVNSQSFPQVHFLSAVRIYYSKTTRR